MKITHFVTLAFLFFTTSTCCCAKNDLGDFQHRHNHHHHHRGGKYKIQKVYGAAAVKQCAGNFGSPKVLTNADFTKVYMFSGCCAENGCVKKDYNAGNLGDTSQGEYAVMQIGEVCYSSGTIKWDPETFTNVTVPFNGNPLVSGTNYHVVRDNIRNRIVLFGMLLPDGLNIPKKSNRPLWDV